MKIVEVNFKISMQDLYYTAKPNEFALMYFKTPAVFSIRGEKISVPGYSIMIFSGETVHIGAYGCDDQIIFDRICFKMNAQEIQNLNSLGIVVNSVIPIRENTVISNIMKAIRNQSVYCKTPNCDFNEHALYMIMLNVIEQMRCGKDVSDNTPYYSELLKLRGQIYSAPENRWNIDEICAELQISRTYFHRIYFSAFGVTCMQDVIESRLECALQMLKETAQTISCIAEKCGYDSESYFMRQFKQHLGCTPSQYRRRFLD